MVLALVIGFSGKSLRITARICATIKNTAPKWEKWSVCLPVTNDNCLGVRRGLLLPPTQAVHRQPGLEWSKVETPAMLPHAQVRIVTVWSEADIIPLLLAGHAFSVQINIWSETYLARYDDLSDITYVAWKSRPKNRPPGLRIRIRILFSNFSGSGIQTLDPDPVLAQILEQKKSAERSLKVIYQ